MKDRLKRTNSKKMNHRVKNALLSCSVVLAVAAVCVTVYAIAQSDLTQSYGKVVEKYDLDIDVDQGLPVTIGEGE